MVFLRKKKSFINLSFNLIFKVKRVHKIFQKKITRIIVSYFTQKEKYLRKKSIVNLYLNKRKKDTYTIHFYFKKKNIYKKGV